MIRLLLGFVAYFVLRYGLSFLLEFALLSGGDVGEGGVLLYVALDAAMQYLLAFPVFLLINRSLKKLPAFLRLERKYTPPQFLRALLLLLFPGMVVLLLTLHTATAPGDIPAYALLQMALLVFLSPFMEEVMSRGVALGALARFGQTKAIWGSTLLFALGHGDPVTALIAFLPGLVMGYVAWQTGGIRYAVLLHMAMNLLGQGLPLLAGLSPVGLAVSYGIAAVLSGAGMFVILRGIHKKEAIL